MAKPSHEQAWRVFSHSLRLRLTQANAPGICDCVRVNISVNVLSSGVASAPWLVVLTSKQVFPSRHGYIRAVPDQN